MPYIRTADAIVPTHTGKDPLPFDVNRDHNPAIAPAAAMAKPTAPSEATRSWIIPLTYGRLPRTKQKANADSRGGVTRSNPFLKAYGVSLCPHARSPEKTEYKIDRTTKMAVGIATTIHGRNGQFMPWPAK